MEDSYKYFCNHRCEYFPCHQGANEEDFNCLFCYCPMNRFEDCLGSPKFISLPGGKMIKDCTNCIFPHQSKNYEIIMDFLKQKMFT